MFEVHFKKLSSHDSPLISWKWRSIPDLKNVTLQEKEKDLNVTVKSFIYFSGETWI